MTRPPSRSRPVTPTPSPTPRRPREGLSDGHGRSYGWSRYVLSGCFLWGFLVLALVGGLLRVLRIN